MDAFLNASPAAQIARARGNRDRSCPIVMPSQMVGHLPDPRVAPTPRHWSLIPAPVVLAVQAAACAAPVAVLWVLFS